MGSGRGVFFDESGPVDGIVTAPKVGWTNHHHGCRG
jgi:hypothetical protein